MTLCGVGWCARFSVDGDTSGEANVSRVTHTTRRRPLSREDDDLRRRRLAQKWSDAQPCRRSPMTRHLAIFAMQHSLPSPSQSFDTSHGRHDVCRTVRARLHNYVAGDLRSDIASEAALLDRIESHIPSCPRCARVEAQLQSMRLAMAAVGARATIQSDAVTQQRVQALIRDVRRQGAHG